MPLGLRIGAGVAAALILIGSVRLLMMRRRRKSVTASATMDRALEGADSAATFEGQLASGAASQERLDADAVLALKLPPSGTKKSELPSKPRACSTSFIR